MTLTMTGGRRRAARRWISVPWLACAGATLILATPLRVAGWQAPEPVFALIPAFGWAALRPSMLAPVALLVLGLLMDLVWGAPLGFWPLCLLVAHAVTLAARRALAGQELPVLWVWYAVACGLALGLGLLLARLRAGAWAALSGVGLQWLATTALFPVAWLMIERYQHGDGRRR